MKTPLTDNAQKRYDTQMRVDLVHVEFARELERKLIRQKNVNKKLRAQLRELQSKNT